LRFPKAEPLVRIFKGETLKLLYLKRRRKAAFYFLSYEQILDYAQAAIAAVKSKAFDKIQVNLNFSFGQSPKPAAIAAVMICNHNGERSCGNNDQSLFPQLPHNFCTKSVFIHHNP
jgi:hypothetical protein